MQAIGAEGVVAAQCRSLVKAYLPQLIKVIATMPPDQVQGPNISDAISKQALCISLLVVAHVACYLLLQAPLAIITTWSCRPKQLASQLG